VCVTEKRLPLFYLWSTVCIEREAEVNGNRKRTKKRRNSYRDRDENSALGFPVLISLSLSISISISISYTGAAPSLQPGHNDLVHDAAYDYYGTTLHTDMQNSHSIARALTACTSFLTGQRLATCGSDHTTRIWEKDADGVWQETGRCQGVSHTATLCKTERSVVCVRLALYS
jgi:hypothetical protein